MKKPNIAEWNPDPGYLRSLIQQTGYGVNRLAAELGVRNREFRYYISPVDSATYKVAPYWFQYLLECVANAKANSTDIHVGNE